MSKLDKSLRGKNLRNTNRKVLPRKSINSDNEIYEETVLPVNTSRQRKDY